MAGRLVMLSVRNLPGEIGDEESGVTEPSYRIIESLGRRKGLMSTLVCQDPEPGTEQSLYKGIDCPKNTPDRRGRHIFGGQECVEEVEGGCQRYDISSNVSKPSHSGAFEAMSWDGVSNLLDGKVGQLEFIAVGVQHLSLAVIENHVRIHG